MCVRASFCSFLNSNSFFSRSMYFIVCLQQIKAMSEMEDVSEPDKVRICSSVTCVYVHHRDTKLLLFEMMEFNVIFNAWLTGNFQFSTHTRTRHVPLML